MIIKVGPYWKACHDEETDRYYCEYGDFQAYHLYEITEEMFELLREDMTESEVCTALNDGRHLYMSVDDRCGPPYVIEFDDECRELCPWAKFLGGGKVWPDELTDAAVEIFASEANNREQRRAKRAKREKAKKGEADDTDN